MLSVSGGRSLLGRASPQARERVRILPWPPDVRCRPGLISATAARRGHGFPDRIVIFTVVGFILALAVHPTHPGSVNVNTVGGYARRTYVDQEPGYGPGYGGYGRWGYPRRRVIEEEEGGNPRGPGY
jgi:hypothetical protein